MNKAFSVFAALAAMFALQSPAHAACVKTGHIHSINIDDSTPSRPARLYLRDQGPASTVVFHFAVADSTVLSAAMAALPSRARVRVEATGAAVCSSGSGDFPIATQIFVTP